LRNVPHFAADGQTFFVTGPDGAYDNWLAVGTMASDPPALLWETGPLVDQDWDFVRWTDNNTVALRDATSSEKCPDGGCEGVLKRSGQGWTLERLPAKSAPK
jgi:hypothetical protein